MPSEYNPETRPIIDEWLADDGPQDNRALRDQVRALIVALEAGNLSSLSKPGTYRRSRSRELIVALEAGNEELGKENEWLRILLRDYGSHQPGCPAVQITRMSPGCNCGWDKAREALRGGDGE